MKIISFCIVLLLSSFQLLAQNTSDAGYFIDKKGNKIECYFKVFDFSEVNSDNPALYFKKNKNESFSKISTSEVTEFGIGSEVKYKKMTVIVDDANLFKDFTYVKEAVTTSQTLFLRILIEGAANLYEYQSDNGYKYFYSIKSKSNSLQQLLYKKYKTDQNIVKENVYFREQLFNNLKCENQSYNDFLSIDYKINSLKEVVENYNKCNNVQSLIFDSKKIGKVLFNITAFAGPRQSSFIMKSELANTDKESKLNYALGIELEMLPPAKKWAGFLSIEYNSSFNAELKSTYLTANGSNLNEDYFVLKSSSVNLLLGPRFYFNRKEFTKLFLDAALGFNLPFGNIVKTGTITNGTGQFPTNSKRADLTSNIYLSFGAGFVYKKIGIAFRMESNRDLYTNKIDGYSNKFTTYGVNLRYQIH